MSDVDAAVRLPNGKARARAGALRRGLIALALGLALGIALPVAACNALTGVDDVELVGGTGAGGATTTHSANGGSAGAGGTEPAGGAGGLGGTGPGPDASTDGADDAAEDAPPDVLDPDGDDDLDGVVNQWDNCPRTFNPCQYDQDGDHLGDDCDDGCDEDCIGRTCGCPGQQGCNCNHGSCPSGYQCIYDSDYETGRRGDVPLPDGGTHHCEPQFHWLCAETCSATEACSCSTCIELGGGCICFGPCMFCEPCS